MRLLQMSLAGGVMIVVITVLRALAMNRVPKKTFLLLWGAALVRLLIPFSLPSRLSIYSLLGRSASVPAAHPPVTARLPAVPMGQEATAADAASVPVWTIVWLVGLAVCVLTFAALYIRCYREFQMSLPVDQDFARRWLTAHPLRRKLAIRQSDRISSPLSFGILRPVILLPKKTDWADEEALRYVLEHEFVHIRRFDSISKLLLIAAACVHWFNPLVWAMYILANRDLELSCDETVLRRFGGDVRGAYARVLIRMEERRRGVQPLCNHFSKNAMEERIRAIMKTKKFTAISLMLAALLVAGTVTVFATSAKQDENIAPVGTAGAVVEQNAANAGGAEAVERGEPLQPSAEYASAGIRAEGSLWYYQGQPVAMLYDDNGGIYMDEKATDGCYLNVRRDSAGGISGVDVLTKEQFRARADRQLNSVPTETTMDEETLMSYIDPADGKTYYSFDDGKTFEPLTDAEFEARFPTPDIEWWTYDEYKAWLDNEKVQLQDMLGQEGWTGGEGSFVWTQEKIDETIALYEEILQDMQNGMLYSKTVDGQDDMLVSYNPADVAMSRDN